MLRYKEAERTDKYKPNLFYETILGKFNDSIYAIEQSLIKELNLSKAPIIFFCYAPRSGSTVISQVLSMTGEFNYVTNFIARFWRAPYIGGIIEKEIGLRTYIKYRTLSSEFGRTKSPIDPHEFGFFWNYWLPSSDSMVLDESEISNIDREGLRNEINALTTLYQKPFFIKSGIAGMNAKILSEIFPRSFFIIIKREYNYIAQSLYKSRKELLGDHAKWLSIKPSNYKSLLKKDVYTQIAGQIIGIYHDISCQLKSLTKSGRVITITYEKFCKNTADSIGKIFKLTNHIPSKKWKEKIPEKLVSNNNIYITNDIFNKLSKALNKYIKN